MFKILLQTELKNERLKNEKTLVKYFQLVLVSIICCKMFSMIERRIILSFIYDHEGASCFIICCKMFLMIECRIILSFIYDHEGACSRLLHSC